MKAVRVHPGDPARLVMGVEADPAVGPHDVLIKVHAASLNFRDQPRVVADVLGEMNSWIPLSDGAGEVVAVGESVTRVTVGDRVTANCWEYWIGGPFLPEYHANSLGFTTNGWLADYIVLHEVAVVRLPERMSYTAAAAIPCAGVSAWASLNRSAPLLPGQTVLVQGTGGVSLFALQIAKTVGARVLAITSSEEKSDRLRELGADAVVNYSENPDWDKEILELTDGIGVHRVVEIAGAKTINKSVAVTRTGGDVALVGFASGMGGGVSPMEVMRRSISMGAVTIGPRLSLESLLSAFGARDVEPVIDSVHAFADYEAAYARAASGKMVGKVVIEM